MNHIETMKQALEALEASRHLLEIEVNKAIARDAADAWIREKEAELRRHDAAITSLRTAIEAAEKQEPVAYKITGKLGDICSFHGGTNVKKGDLVYTTPPAAPVQYPLPDDMYDSKDWKAGSYVERVEWLHTMYESSKQTLEAYTSAPVQAPVLVRDVAEVFGRSVHEVSAALVRLGHPPRSTNMAVSGEELTAIAAELKPSPPAAQRQWVGLTLEEGRALVEQARKVPGDVPCLDYNERLLALADAKLREKNGGAA